jgi:hypothetical protein
MGIRECKINCRLPAGRITQFLDSSLQVEILDRRFIKGLYGLSRVPAGSAIRAIGMVMTGDGTCGNMQSALDTNWITGL